MGNDAGDVLDRQTRLFERFFCCAQHCRHRLLVNFLAGHVNGDQV